MSSKNVETLRSAHESWNRRDFAGVLRDLADNIVYTDHARNLTLRGKPEFRQWLEAWVQAFPDGKITQSEYIDAGDLVIAQFIAEGTNSGPLAGLAPTGRRLSFPFCEIFRFDKSGRMVSGGCYYDQYTILTQTGHIQPLSAAA